SGRGKCRAARRSARALLGASARRARVEVLLLVVEPADGGAGETRGGCAARPEPPDAVSLRRRRKVHRPLQCVGATPRTARAAPSMAALSADPCRTSAPRTTTHHPPSGTRNRPCSWDVHRPPDGPRSIAPTLLASR